MQSWSLHSLSLRVHSPRVLASTDEARAIVLALPAGEALQDHQVHERAWVVVVEGRVEVLTHGERTTLGAGSLCSFDPNERHEVHALADTRLLIILTPWPGTGHPGAMTLESKAVVRARAREHRLPPAAGGEGGTPSDAH